MKFPETLTPDQQRQFQQMAVDAFAMLVTTRAALRKKILTPAKTVGYLDKQIAQLTVALDTLVVTEEKEPKKIAGKLKVSTWAAENLDGHTLGDDTFLRRSFETQTGERADWPLGKSWHQMVDGVIASGGYLDYAPGLIIAHEDIGCWIHRKYCTLDEKRINEGSGRMMGRGSSHRARIEEVAQSGA